MISILASQKLHSMCTTKSEQFRGVKSLSSDEARRVKLTVIGGNANEDTNEQVNRNVVAHHS